MIGAEPGAQGKRTMSEINDYIVAGLDLRNKTILDAAVGAGGCIWYWAKRVHEQGGSSRIIAVDNDLPDEWRERILRRLGDYARHVELREADIFDLGFLDDASVDLVNCHDTLVFLNPTPLKLLDAFREFHRVLKASGQLIVTSEVPVAGPETPNGEGQWRRWNLAKALFALKGESWSCEPLAAEVSATLARVGFRVGEQRTFPARRDSEHVRESIDEWRGVMREAVDSLPWDALKPSLTEEVERVRAKVLDDGYLLSPGRYVLKCRKA